MPTQVILETLFYHRFFATLLFLPPLLALIFLYFSRNFPYLIRRIRLLTPAYGFLLASSALTGIVTAFILQTFNLAVFIMILGLFLLIIGEIKRYKKQRIIASYDTEPQKEFIRWAKRKYIFDLLLLVAIFGIYESKIYTSFF